VGFQAACAARFADRRASGLLAAARSACRELDLRCEGMGDASVLWPLLPARQALLEAELAQRQQLEEREQRGGGGRAPRRDAVAAQLAAAAAAAAGAGPADAEFSAEELAFEELPVAAKLKECVDYLRETHNYVRRSLTATGSRGHSQPRLPAAQPANGTMAAHARSARLPHHCLTHITPPPAPCATSAPFAAHRSNRRRSSHRSAPARPRWTISCIRPSGRDGDTRTPLKADSGD
jgi:hypothetical protein